VISHRASFRVPATHPALPGHFPGRPVVPGVLLLHGVLAAAEAWLGAPLAVAGLPAVKFLAPLLPEQDAELLLERKGNTLRFQAVHAGVLLAQGTLELAP